MKHIMILYRIADNTDRGMRIANLLTSPEAIGSSASGAQREGEKFVYSMFWVGSAAASKQDVAEVMDARQERWGAAGDTRRAGGAR